MIKLLITFIWCFTLVALVVTFVPQCAGAFMINGHWTEKKCGLCEKRIYSYSEASFSPSMPHYVGQAFCVYGEERRAESFYTIIPMVCGECKRAFQGNLSEAISLWIESIRSKNKLKIKASQSESRSYHIQEKQAKIDKLMQQVEILEGETK